jgi:hypothetical protein
MIEKNDQEKIDKSTNDGKVTAASVGAKLDAKVKAVKDAVGKALPRAKMLGIDKAITDAVELMSYTAGRAAQLEADFWGLNERVLMLEAQAKARG